MVKGFPTKTKMIGEKKVTFVRVGGYDKEISLFPTKARAKDWADFNRKVNNIRCFLEKVAGGGYYVWSEWKPVTKPKRKTMRKKG